jgi:hypothetical protein
MKSDSRARKWLDKKARRGVRGYPVGTIAFYGPDSRLATKVAVGIVPAPESEPAELRRWVVETGDVRTDETVSTEIVMFLREHDVRSVAMADNMLGCPHEEGIDYPKGEVCPHCPYWAGRNRWTGKLELGESVLFPAEARR